MAKIIRDLTGKWEASIRPCGTEFGGDHHLYVDFLDKNGNDCRTGKSIVVRRGDSVGVYASEKPIGEPAINIPIWRGESIDVYVADSGVSGTDIVNGITTSRAEDGNLYHQSFYLVFRERTTQTATPVEPPVTQPVTDKETKKQAAIDMLYQAIEMIKSL